MSQLSKREEVWLLGYREWNDVDNADKLLKEFDERFPVKGGFCIDPELKEVIDSDNTPAKVFKLNTESSFGINLQNVARDLTRFLIEKEEKDILELVGQFSIHALCRMRDVIVPTIERKYREERDKETNSQL